ncbi:Uncharacterised protein [uncultured Ruminococcus sp.]|nr:Uncharacterised protein [uncultured Ruminococcus sp.]
MSTTIEQLELEVQSNSTSAVGGIDALSESLRRLKAATAPVSKGGVGLGALSDSLKKFSSSVSGLTGLTLAKKQVQGLVDALKPLENVQKSGFNSLASGLAKLVKIAPQIDTVTESLRKTDLTSFAEQCNRVAAAITPLAFQMEKVAAGFAAFPVKIQRLLKENSNLTTSNTGLSKSYVNLAAKIGIALVSMKKIASGLANMVNKSNKYIEDLNLFNASMGEYAAQAQEYAGRVGEIMGIDPGEWMRNQGIFMTLATGFGVASDRAYLMSQNLTQLGYDISSFFNISFEDSMQKLQSGLAGELEPLRRIGYDLSVARLQQEAYTLGIEKSVSAMTQAEKAELRYYAIMTQVTTAQGDMARTLEAPANQLRILKAQVEQCARAIGNIFIPILNTILPYLIAVTKVIRLVADIIAKLFGFTLPKVDYSGLSGAANSAENVADGLGSAAEKAKELKNALLGIDELNIISPADNSDSGSSGLNAGGGGLGFDLPTYDFLGNAVNTRVDEIVQKMKEWLGITGEINNWSDLFNTRLGKILIAVGLIGSAFLLWKLSKTFTTAFSIISSLFGGGKKAGNIGKGFSVPSPKTVLKGLADIAIIIGGVISLVEVIGLLMQIPGFEQAANKGIETVGTVFNGLGNIILPLTAVSAGIIGLGKLGVASVSKGFADLSIIIGGAAVLITAIGALISIPYFSGFLATGVNSIVLAFNGLWEVALPIGTLSALLIALGIATPAVILSGLAGFALVIGGIELVLIALGALNQIPGFSWIVGEGGKVLIQLGEILGGFAGSIVNSFLTKVSESFPEIGKNLAAFMQEAQPFFTGLDSVNAESVDAAKKLAEMILILTAADVLEGLTSWLTGGSSITKFGQELCDFAPKLREYCAAVGGLTSDDLKSVQASADVTIALAEMASKIPKTGGLAQAFTGISDMKQFGEQLVSFGGSITEYSKTVATLKTEAITASAAAAESLVELANQLPSINGVAQFFTGSQDMAVFGEQIVTFGESIAKYAETVTGLDTKVIVASAAAAESLVELSHNLEPMYGTVQFFTGQKDLGLFGSQLVLFGKGIYSYYTSIQFVKPNIVTASSNAAKALVELTNMLPNQGGLFSLFTGDKNIATFSNDLVVFGRNFKNYYNYVSGITTGKISSVSSEMNKIIDWSVKVSSVDTRSIENFSSALKKLGEDFAACAKNIITGFTSKISTAYSTSKSAVISWGNNVKNWFTQSSYGGINRTTFQNYAKDIVSGFGSGVTSSYNNSKSSMTSWASNVKKWFTEIASRSAFYEIARDVVSGFNSGINDLYNTSRTYMRRWANDAAEAFKDALDSNSPSKVFERIGGDTVLGYNNGIANLGKTTKSVVDTWANSFTSVSPVMRFAVDTSALKYYTSDSFSKSVSADVTSSRNFSVTGFKEGLEEFYREYIEPTLSQMADDVHKQADKNEQTIVQIGNRTVTDAVTTQRKANGYVFVK